MKHHLHLLGYKVRDVVTGFQGTVTHIGFELYGCIQAIVQPEVKEDGKPGESQWFDLKRLICISEKPVMEVPSFEDIPGGDEKPPFRVEPTK